MSLVCLLGRHGSGKTTIGADLVEHGFQHTSVGMLRRLAQASQFPIDVPAALMMAMRRERPGAPMALGTAKKLIEHVLKSPRPILDGFPSTVEQVTLLPAETIFCVVWAPTHVRLQRLERRSETTKRLWTPGLHSEREIALPALIRNLRRDGRCIFVANDGSRDDAIARFLKKLPPA